MPLYRIVELKAGQLRPSGFPNEKALQAFFETNLEELLGVRFIASEFTTGDRQRGRIDTLGLDEDGSPTIIEYKKTSNANIINQGLFYLDWLVDHKGDFLVAAKDALGQDVEIEWSHPRLILIAEGFTDYDKYAVNRIGANIELWTYQLYEGNMLHLEPIYLTNVQPPRKQTPGLDTTEVSAEEPVTYSVDDHLDGKPRETQELFEALRSRILSLAAEGEIIEKPNKNYVSYKHGKNFAEVWIQASGLKLWLDVPSDELDDPNEYARDVSNVGHWGTGNTEVTLSSPEEVEIILALIEQSFRRTL